MPQLPSFPDIYRLHTFIPCFLNWMRVLSTRSSSTRHFGSVGVWFFYSFCRWKKSINYIPSCITHHPPESPFIHPPELLIKPAEWCPFVVALCFVGVWSFLHCIGPLAYLSSLMVAWCSLYSFLPPRFPFLFFSFFLSYLPALPKYSTKSHRICLCCDLLFFLFSFLFSILVLRTMLNECIRFDEKIIKSIW